MRFLRRRRDDMPDAEERERARREQIEILSALAAAVDDWATVVPLVGSCATFDEAVEELSLLLDVDEEGRERSWTCSCAGWSSGSGRGSGTTWAS